MTEEEDGSSVGQLASANRRNEDSPRHVSLHVGILEQVTVTFLLEKDGLIESITLNFGRARCPAFIKTGISILRLIWAHY